MVSALTEPLHDPGWLRGGRFDSAFLIAIPLVAIASGFAVVRHPSLFLPILFLDLWLLGYHHVVATFTRLAFDRQSLARHRFLVFGLAPIVFAATFAVAAAVGIWVIVSVYLYWQWFHYTRQSWGIGQIYKRKSGGLVDDGRPFALASFYLVPLWGILYRSWQAPETFLTMELRVVPVPELLVELVGAAAVLSVVAFGWSRFRAWRDGRLPVAHTAYVLSHYLIFLIGYRVIEDITYGWLVINIWHNAQYILFVWAFNASRFPNGIERGARFLSWLSQPQRKTVYFTVCFLLSSAAYFAIATLTSAQMVVGLPMALLIYQSINFHHYIVDSLIWKGRSAPMQRTLGLSKA